MNKLTEDDFTTFDLDGEEYYQWSGSKEKMKQILDSQNNELEQENKQLKEELDAMIKHKIMFEHSFSEVNHKVNILKQKLEQIKKLYLKHNPKVTYGSQEKPIHESVSAPQKDSPQITHGKLRPTLDEGLKEILDSQEKE